MIKAFGHIFMTTWDGTNGTYPTNELIANSRDELLEKITAMNGDYRELDSGMGCERAHGVVLKVFECKNEDGWESRRKLEPIVFVDALKESQKEFLLDVAGVEYA
jgi:hypothetical protein